MFHQVLTEDEYQSSLWFPSLPKNSTHASVIVSGAIYSETTIIGRVVSGVAGDRVHCVFYQGVRLPGCLWKQKPRALLESTKNTFDPPKGAPEVFFAHNLCNVRT